MPPARPPRVEPTGLFEGTGRPRVLAVAGVAIRLAGAVIVALFLVGATVGTGVVPIDNAATAIRAQATGSPPPATATENQTLIDTDQDGIGETTERRHGTDPSDADTDGDRIPDGWEVEGETPGGAPLPDSDPTRLDLYVLPQYSAGIAPLTDREQSALVRAFDTMPVENPDGTRGIDVHFLSAVGDRRLDRRVTLESRGFQTVKRLERRFYRPAYVGDYGCLAHQMLFVHVASEEFAGVGAGPGYQAFVDGTAMRDYGTPYSVRVGTAVHELLHNVVGDIDSRPGPSAGVHTAGGWLSHGEFRWNQYLSETTRTELADGFATSRYYERRCSS